ncbi:hypothetical protein GJ496_000320 [Pomphorhynchus laevis]|nr:hypothetical protein GJ496_000320 [Pomphorhynchus laevis]
MEFHSVLTLFDYQDVSSLLDIAYLESCSKETLLSNSCAKVGCIVNDFHKYATLHDVYTSGNDGKSSQTMSLGNVHTHKQHNCKSDYKSTTKIDNEDRQRRSTTKIDNEDRQRRSTTKIDNEDRQRRSTTKIDNEDRQRRSTTKIDNEDRQRRSTTKIDNEDRQRRSTTKIDNEDRQRRSTTKIDNLKLLKTSNEVSLARLK